MCVILLTQEPAFWLLWMCAEDERRSYGFGTTQGWIINDRILIINFKGGTKPSKHPEHSINCLATAQSILATTEKLLLKEKLFLCFTLSVFFTQNDPNYPQEKILMIWYSMWMWNGFISRSFEYLLTNEITIGFSILHSAIKCAECCQSLKATEQLSC